MQVRVAWFGRPQRSPYEAEITTYLKRVARRWPAADVPLRPVTGGRDRDAARVLAAEADAVRRQRPPGWQLWVLDEAGTTVDSEGLARRLEKVETGPAHGVLLVVGSDLGVAADLRVEADLVLSLGQLTLPHLLARLLLWEQLYRAVDILSGGSYHRGRL